MCGQGSWQEDKWAVTSAAGGVRIWDGAGPGSADAGEELGWAAPNVKGTLPNSLLPD